MIVFTYELLEEFLQNLDRRISDEVFSQYLEPEASLGASPSNHKLILQYLGKPDKTNQSLLVLHQCRIRIKIKKERDDIIQHLQGAFEKAGDIKLIQGAITEIFHSIS